MRNAVIVVHGISPHPRYEIQDAFANGLRAALQDETDADRAARLGPHAPKASGAWMTGIVWPAVRQDQPVEESPVMALRVECKDSGGTNVASEPTIDVFEGYWSPIDKEQTTPWRVLSWLLAAAFVPLNDVRVPARLAKLAYDVILTGLALAVGLTAIVVVASSAVRAYHAYVTTVSNDLVGLLVAAVGAYLLAQVLARLFLAVTGQGRMSLWSWVLLVALAIAGLMLLGWPTRGAENVVWGASLTGPRAWLLASAIALRFVFGFAKNFLVDAVGDIQIYTTHDENARFYQFRAQIIRTVGEVAVQVLRSVDGKGELLYDKVFLVGHSLGSTVLMDVIIAVHALVEEQGLPAEAWRRIRAFLTFGSALEKTRFFFDVRNEKLSPTIVQYRKDVYGHLFTPDASVLGRDIPQAQQPPAGIYWTNYWYFTDVVANEIISYTSSRVPGEDLTQQAVRPEHPICVNIQLRSPFTIWPHSQYLSDPSFWHTDQHLGAAAIVARA